MQSYEAAAFFPGLADGRASGRLRVCAGALHFETEGGAGVALPLDGLELRLGGASDRLVFFEHPSQPEWSVYTADHAVLQDAALTSLPTLAGRIAALRRKRRRGYAVTAAVPLALAGLIAGLVVGRQPLVRLIADRIPVGLEVSLGEGVFAQMRGQQVLLDSPALEASLEQLTRRLLAVVPSRGYDFHFHIADDGAVNAFALPGGPVVIHSGLILAADGPEEVAGVLAHEIAHVTQRHGLRQIVSSVGLFTLVQAVFGDLTGLAAVLTSGGAELLSLRFSRDFEREADAEGWRYLVAARIDPRGMIRFFEKLEREARSAGGQESATSLAFLSTHPTTPERLERLGASLAELPASTRFEPIDVDFVAFQQALRQARSLTQQAGKETDASQD